MNAASPDELIGTVVDGRYSVLEHIADGGMARVYRAVDTRLDRDVALKVMRPHLARDDAFVRRFHREAKAAARLAHPNVVGVYDQGAADGLVFLAMEYVPGRTLRAVLDADGPLTPRAVLDIADPMAQALAAAHAAGIMHRDVKPENVLIRDDGAVKVADFGLARDVKSQTATSATDEVLGTLSYVSPEQVELNNVTPRSDVYSAGLILSEMLTGRKVFSGDTIANVLYQHLNGEVAPPSSVRPGLPLALDRLVTHACAKDPADRPADGGELLAEVQAVRRSLSADELDTRGPAREGLPPSAGATVALPLPAVDGPARTGSTAPLTPAAAASSTGSTAPLTSAAAAAPPTGPVAAPPGRRSRGGPILALVALVAAAVAGGWYFLSGPGSPTIVPNLVELTVSQAQSALSARDLKSKVVEDFSETVDPGIVLAATPREGAEVRRNSTITLSVSKGPERYEVPDLAGKTQAQATELLADSNLEVAKVNESFSDDVEDGKVITSNPKAGTPLKRGAGVTLTVSKGPEPVDVPDLVGLSYSAAVAKADGLGLTLERGDDVFDKATAKGQVARQDPNTGTLVRGDTITVQVSKGPRMVRVPSVFRRTQAQATAILEEAGFVVKVQKFLGAPLDTVTGQSPPGGSTAPEGSTVTITLV